MRDAKREAALLQVRALEPSVDRRQVTTHVDGHLAREANLGPSAKAVINIAGGVCCSRGDRRGGSKVASRSRRRVRLEPDPTGNPISQRAARLVRRSSHLNEASEGGIAPGEPKNRRYTAHCQSDGARDEVMCAEARERPAE